MQKRDIDGCMPIGLICVPHNMQRKTEMNVTKVTSVLLRFGKVSFVDPLLIIMDDAHLEHPYFAQKMHAFHFK